MALGSGQGGFPSSTYTPNEGALELLHYLIGPKESNKLSMLYWVGCIWYFKVGFHIISNNHQNEQIV